MQSDGRVQVERSSKVFEQRDVLSVCSWGRLIWVGDTGYGEDTANEERIGAWKCNSRKVRLCRTEKRGMVGVGEAS